MGIAASLLLPWWSRRRLSVEADGAVRRRFYFTGYAGNAEVRFIDAMTVVAICNKIEADCCLWKTPTRPQRFPQPEAPRDFYTASLSNKKAAASFAPIPERTASVPSAIP